jgi:hypothetical protein
LIANQDRLRSGGISPGFSAICRQYREVARLIPIDQTLVRKAFRPFSDVRAGIFDYQEFPVQAKYQAAFSPGSSGTETSCSSYQPASADIFHDFAKISGIRAADDSAWHATDEIFPGAITQPWPGAYTIRARTGIRGGEVSPDIIGL